MTLTALARALQISKGQASKLVRRGMPAHNVAAAREWRESTLRPYFRAPEEDMVVPQLEGTPNDPVARTLRMLVPALFFQPELIALSTLDAGLTLTGEQALTLTETLMLSFMTVTEAALGSEGQYQIPDDLACSPKQRTAVIRRLDELLAEYRRVDPGRKLN